MGYHAYSVPSALFNPTIRPQTSFLEVIVGSCAAEVVVSSVSTASAVSVVSAAVDVLGVDVTRVIDSNAAALAALVVIVVVGEVEVEGVGVVEGPKTVLRMEVLGEGEMGVDLGKLSW